MNQFIKQVSMHKPAACVSGVMMHVLVDNAFGYTWRTGITGKQWEMPIDRR